MPKECIVIKNITSEGPGTIAEYLTSAGHPFRVLDLSRKETLPADPKTIAAVIVLGGPMNVYEEDKYPYLRAENIFIKQVLVANIPFLGICLGAQLLAKAAGAKVYKTRTEELGWSSVSLTSAGKADRIFQGLETEFEVFQWHGDTFDLPEGAILLAQGKAVKNQAFRVGQSAYGLQFHVEVNEPIIRDWFKGKPEKEACLRHLKEIQSGFREQAEKIYRNFFG